MKPLRVPGDPAKAIRDHFAAVLPGLLDAPLPTIALNVPDDWTRDSAPHVGVFDDGGPTLWPIYAEPVVRVTVWANGRTLSRTIAGVCLGILYAHTITGVAQVTDISGLLEARDPKNLGLMTSLTANIKARTLPIS